MKRTLLFLTAMLTLAGFTNAQGNAKNKGNGNNNEKVKQVKDKDKADKEKADKDKAIKDKAEKAKHESAIWGGTKDSDGGGPKPSKNQPAKVRSAFQRDYPNATSVSWSKYRGDWTATFRNGFYWSTAIYHANGDRRDTRTQIPPTQLPRKIDDIFKKKPDEKVEEAVKIEIPQSMKDIFRIKTSTPTTTSTGTGISKGTKVMYKLFDIDGKEVQYNY